MNCLYILESNLLLVASFENISSHSVCCLFILFVVSFDMQRALLVTQIVKNLPAMQDTWVQSLCWEDPLKKGMTSHSSILAWRNPQTAELGRLQSMGSQRARHNWATFTFDVWKLFSLISSHLLIFVFIFISIGGRSKKTLLGLKSKSVPPMSSKSFSFQPYI